MLAVRTLPLTTFTTMLMSLTCRLCLQKLGVLTKEDNTAVVIKVFSKYVRFPALRRTARLTKDSCRYMQIARALQTEYWLEPAGSHGAQGLDDYHFAVFSSFPSLLPFRTAH